MTLALLLLFRLSFPHFSATSIATCIVCSVTALPQLPNTLQAEIVCHVPANGHFHPSKVFSSSQASTPFLLLCWCYSKSLHIGAPLLPELPTIPWATKEAMTGCEVIRASYGRAMATRIGYTNWYTPWYEMLRIYGGSVPPLWFFGHKNSIFRGHEGSHAQISRMFSNVFLLFWLKKASAQTLSQPIARALPQVRLDASTSWRVAACTAPPFVTQSHAAVPPARRFIVFVSFRPERFSDGFQSSSTCAETCPTTGRRSRPNWRIGRLRRHQLEKPLTSPWNTAPVRWPSGTRQTHLGQTWSDHFLTVGFHSTLASLLTELLPLVSKKRAATKYFVYLQNRIIIGAPA